MRGGDGPVAGDATGPSLLLMPNLVAALPDGYVTSMRLAWNLIIYVLATVGFVTLVVTAWLAVAILKPHAVRSEAFGTYRSVLSDAGMDPALNYKLVWDRSEGLGAYGPFDVVCLQVLDADFAPSASFWDNDWTDPRTQALARDAYDGRARGCLPAGAESAPPTTVAAISTTYEFDRLRQAVILWYHPPTQRLLYMNINVPG